jgi:hypothetical protein
MASFIRTTPTQPAAESLWRRWHLGWVVPLATAATAAAIWIAIPDNPTTSQFSSAPEANAIARSQVSAEPIPQLREEPEPSRAAPLPTMRSIERQDQKAKVAESVANETRQRANTDASPEVTDLRATQPAAPSVAGAAAAPVAVAPTAPPPAAAAERAELDAKKETAADSTVVPLAAPRRAVAADQIATPDGSARWRIINGQQVERSTNGGASWTAAAINSPDRLTAGAAPSGAVCWIVGARGAIYLTTDGTRFVRLPFTEMVDLTEVFASDARTATVSSADGRFWRTTDQGKTWLSSR